MNTTPTSPQHSAAVDAAKRPDQGAGQPLYAGFEQKKAQNEFQ